MNWIRTKRSPRAPRRPPRHAVTGSGAAKQRETQLARTPVEIERAISRADAALGASGHQVTDEETRVLGRQIAAGTVTGDEATACIIEKLRATHHRG